MSVIGTLDKRTLNKGDKHVTQNENREDDIRTQPLGDLLVSDEQAEETKAGTVTVTGTTGTFRLTFNGQTTL
jgi:hypothetical protein